MFQPMKKSLPFFYHYKKEPSDVLCPLTQLKDKRTCESPLRGCLLLTSMEGTNNERNWQERTGP